MLKAQLFFELFFEGKMARAVRGCAKPAEGINKERV